MPAFSDYAPDMAIVASAAESGTCGENLTWTLDDEGTLTISGTGDMENYSSHSSPFYYRGAIKAVIIEDGVTSIGDYAFEYCSNLASITIPDSVTCIGNYAFYYCYNLESINIPDSVTSIGNYAFWNCSSLTSLTIPDSVTSIGNDAFSGCSSLTSINIPDSVTRIGDYAFCGCYNLESITIQNPDSQIYEARTTICSGYNDLIGLYDFNGTIYGYENSTAQAYAEKYEYNFESLGEAPFSDILGDVGGNEIVDGRDASMVLTHYALISANKPGVITGTQALLNADWDQNEVVDGRDASAILTYYAEQSVQK